MSTAAGTAGGITPERTVALRVLRRVDEGAYADRALAAEARRAELDPRARAVATRPGLRRGAAQPDARLAHRRRPRPARGPRARRAGHPAPRGVRGGLLRRDPRPRRRRPGRPAGPGLRGAKARSSARAGLVNAVMRRIAADARDRLAGLDEGGAATAGLRHSMPDWIVARLTESLGDEDAIGVMRAANAPAESALRWNPLRGPREDLEAELPDGWTRDPAIPEAYVLGGAFALEDSQAWERGLAIGQSRASQMVAHAVAPRRGERILDLCAAPGAKTTHMAALAEGGARITAVELRPARAATLRTLAARMGAEVEVVEGDAREVPLEEGFDAVLLDPPCTGLGVLSSRPDARWKRRESSIAPLTALQRALLDRALSLVRPGGRVVYSTCTLIAAENEDVVRAAGAPLDDLAAERPELAHPRLPGALLTLPHRHGTDGFFIARLRRPESA